MEYLEQRTLFTILKQIQTVNNLRDVQKNTLEPIHCLKLKYCRE